MEFIIIIIVVLVILILFFSSNLGLRLRGKKTTGEVTDINSNTWTDQYGVSHTSYSIIYNFRTEDGRVYQGKKSIGSRRLSRGTAVTVYYSPKNPNRSDVSF